MYRIISSAFWTDPKVRSLEADGKLLLLYLITNPHTHVSGIYVLPQMIIHLETRLTKPKVDTLCDTLSSAGFCAFDWDKEVVWVRRMMSYQGKGEKNLRSAAFHVVRDLHNSFLCRDFLDLYPNVSKFVPPNFLDTVSHRVSHRVSRVGSLILDSDTDTDTDTEERSVEREKNTLSGTRRKTRVPDHLDLTPEMHGFAQTQGVFDPIAETEAMIDHFRASGDTKLDWIATWRNWMRNHKKFGGRRERHKSKTDRNRENAEKLMSRFDFEDSSSRRS